MTDFSFILTIVGVALGTMLAHVIPRLPAYFRLARAKYHVWRYFRTQKTGVMAGFGLAVNGHPVMEKNEPLLFTKPKEAEEYAKKRDFYRINFATRLPNKVKVIYQNWDLEAGTFTWSEVLYAA